MDALARILAELMRTSLGQPVIIENVSGAGGSIGVGRVARAAPLHRTHFRRIPKTFFYLGSMRTWQPRGRERDQLRGSFLPPNSNAGGNRARDRQLQLIKIKLDTLTG
jgi:hypothetical protein